MTESCSMSWDPASAAGPVLMSLPFLTVVSHSCGCMLTKDINVLNMMHEIPSRVIPALKQRWRCWKWSWRWRC